LPFGRRESGVEEVKERRDGAGKSVKKWCEHADFLGSLA
jgi:hypothetical protein